MKTAKGSGRPLRGPTHGERGIFLAKTIKGLTALEREESFGEDHKGLNGPGDLSVKTKKG